MSFKVGHRRTKIRVAVPLHRVSLPYPVLLKRFNCFFKLEISTFHQWKLSHMLPFLNFLFHSCTSSIARIVKTMLNNSWCIKHVYVNNNILLCLYVAWRCNIFRILIIYILVIKSNNIPLFTYIKMLKIAQTLMLLNLHLTQHNRTGSYCRLTGIKKNNNK